MRVAAWVVAHWALLLQGRSMPGSKTEPLRKGGLYLTLAPSAPTPCLTLPPIFALYAMPTMQ